MKQQCFLQGSVRQEACPPGSYQLRQGQGSCETCPAGYYCQDQGKAYMWSNCWMIDMIDRCEHFFLYSYIYTSGMTHPLLCEKGFYCPRGSANHYPCPAGTYGNMSGLVEKWQCSLCDPGMYCKGTGMM